MPPVLTCSAVEMNGIRGIWQTVLGHRRKFATSGELKLKRQQQALAWMWSLIEEGLKFRFNQHPEVKKRLPKLSRGVASGATAPTIAAEELLFFLDNQELV
jgi:LAO/AO transport system kinase